jgi:molybdopterin-synthase adenylyltransferase
VTDDRYSRNEALFGVRGQRKIAATKVGIVGLGGLGSHVAQQLAYLGVLDHGLVDGDFVTYSSLNRVIGANEIDARDRAWKVDVAKRMIEQLQVDARIRVARSWLEDDEARRILHDAEVIFGCVDNDLARLELIELASHLRAPYIDLASDTGGEGIDLWYGGRVVFSRGRGCLSCFGLLDQGEIRNARMSIGEREVDDRIYGVSPDVLETTGPAVVSVNGVVASLAVTEFIAWRTGLRDPVRQLTYRGDRATVGSNRDEPSASCFYCQRWQAAQERRPAA